MAAPGMEPAPSVQTNIGQCLRSIVNGVGICVTLRAPGAVQSLISCPVELLKIRQQLQHSMPGSPGYVGPSGVLQQVLRSEGVPGARKAYCTLARAGYCTCAIA